jgi:hypothetical protein
MFYMFHTRLIMFKILSLLLFFVMSQYMLAQHEEQVPLIQNHQLVSNQLLQKEGAIHNRFIYLFDTIQLPFLDEFTTNKFKQFNAITSDPNVTNETFFRLAQSGNPLPMGTEFSLDTTFTFQYYLVPDINGNDSVALVNKIPFPAQLITVFNIDAFPVTFEDVEVWPNYNHYDSLWTGSSPDEVITQFPIDLFQDSATIYFVHPVAADAAILWKDDHTFHNYTYAKNPQTLGVVTFDGLNRYGYPYNFQSANAKGLADVLTSKPINMSGLMPSDSIYFSFLYQRAGWGEVPDAIDSLVLEFWSPLVNDWTSVWRAKGGTADTHFKTVHFPIVSPLYLMNGFQFRFKSFGTLTGSLDVWHIDYVHLNKFRAYDDTLTNDWAFSLPAPSLLKQYTSMPWPHYEYAPLAPIKISTALATYNSFVNSIFVQPSNMRLYHENNLLETVPYVITSPNVNGTSYFDMQYTIPPTFWFDTIYADTCATFDVVYTLGTNTINDLKVNDTLRQQQYFCNYYSYDDGTAEAAYGLVMAGAELAYKFTMPSGLTDTLRAVAMHFSPSVNDMSNELFFMQVWADNNGQPGTLIYSTDDDFIPYYYKPEYNIGNNGFFEYQLPDKLLVSGTFYVGWKQVSANRLNIGMDLNNNQQDKIYYKTGSSWATTSFQGSLMMRPVFASGKDYLMNLLVHQQPESFEVTVFPNPASTYVEVYVNEMFTGTIEVFDVMGKKIQEQSFSTATTIDTQAFDKGVYLLKITHQQGATKVVKLMVQ